MEQPTTQPAAPVTPVVTQPAKKSNTLVIILVVVFGILALCGGVVLFSIFKARDLFKNSEFVNEVRQQVENQNNNDYDGTEYDSQDSSNDDTTITDTCSYMSKAQLSAAIGKNITTETSDDNKKTCTYTTDPNNYNDAVIMIVSIEKPTTGQSAKNYVDIVKSSIFTTDVETVSIKTAESAFWGTEAKMLIASKGNKVLLIAVQTLSDTDNTKEYARKAADLVMPKL